MKILCYHDARVYTIIFEGEEDMRELKSIGALPAHVERGKMHATCEQLDALAADARLSDRFREDLTRIHIESHLKELRDMGVELGWATA